MDKCENCGRIIGNLETPCLFEEHVVCRGCYGVLALPQPKTPMAFTSTVPPVEPPVEPPPIPSAVDQIHAAQQHWPIYRKVRIPERRHNDPLFLPRMIFLILFLCSAIVSPLIGLMMLACWLALGIAGLIMQSSAK